MRPPSEPPRLRQSGISRVSYPLSARRADLQGKPRAKTRANRLLKGHEKTYKLGEAFLSPRNLEDSRAARASAVQRPIIRRWSCPKSRGFWPHEFGSGPGCLRAAQI